MNAMNVTTIPTPNAPKRFIFSTLSLFNSLKKPLFLDLFLATLSSYISVFIFFLAVPFMMPNWKFLLRYVTQL